MTKLKLSECTNCWHWAFGAKNLKGNLWHYRQPCESIFTAARLWLLLLSAFSSVDTCISFWFFNFWGKINFLTRIVDFCNSILLFGETWFFEGVCVCVCVWAPVIFLINVCGPIEQLMLLWWSFQERNLSLLCNA